MTMEILHSVRRCGQGFQPGGRYRATGRRLSNYDPEFSPMAGLFPTPSGGMRSAGRRKLLEQADNSPFGFVA